MERMKLPAPCIELDNFNSDYWSLKLSQCSELPMCLMSLNESSMIRSSSLWSLPLHNLASLFKLSIHGPAESSLHFRYHSRVWLMFYLIFSEKELFIFSSRAMLVCSEGIFLLYKFCGHRAVILSSQWICLVKSTNVELGSRKISVWRSLYVK